MTFWSIKCTISGHIPLEYIGLPMNLSVDLSILLSSTSYVSLTVHPKM